MSIIPAPITNLIQRLFPATKLAPTTSMEAASKIKRWSYRTPELARFQVERTRQAIIKDCLEMYDNGLSHVVIGTLARDIIDGGFEIVVTIPPKADKKLIASLQETQQIADNLIKDLDLISRMDDLARIALLYGDAFVEKGITADGSIAEISVKPAPFMYRNSDLFDHFENPDEAYYYSELGALGGSRVYFSQWQIQHVRANHDEGNRYGTPEFAAARSAWKMFVDGLLNVALRRKHASNRTQLHVLEGADETAIEAYKENNRQALESPFAAVTDFFTNRVGGIVRLDGATDVGDTKDILLHLNHWFGHSAVPIEFIGKFGENANSLAGEALAHKKEQYTETIQVYKQWLEKDAIKPLFEQAWLLKGKYPPNFEYKIKWLPKTTPNAADIEKAAKAVALLRATGLLPDESLVELLVSLLPGVSRDKAIEALKNRPDEIGRFATNGAVKE